MSWQDVASHYQEPDDDEPDRVTVPAVPAVGQMFMESERHGLWSVYGWSPGECRSCRGIGKILARDSGEPADRKCSDCGGTGSDHDEPELIASGLYELDARFIVFGRALLTACAKARHELMHGGFWGLVDQLDAAMAPLSTTPPAATPD